MIKVSIMISFEVFREVPRNIGNIKFVKIIHIKKKNMSTSLNELLDQLRSISPEVAESRFVEISCNTIGTYIVNSFL